MGYMKYSLKTKDSLKLSQNIAAHFIQIKECIKQKTMETDSENNV